MSPAIITLLVLIGAAVLFVTEVIPVAVTALSVGIILYLTGVIDAKTAFSGLMNETTILIAGMLVVGGALFETGVAQRMGNTIRKYAKTEKTLLLSVLVVGSVISAFLSNTSTTAVMMPIVLSIVATNGYNKAKFLIQLAFAANMGGTMTLIGTPPNIVVQGALLDAGLTTFGFFEYAKIGIPLTIAGIVYMMNFGFRILEKGHNSCLEANDTASFNSFNAEDKRKSGIKQFIALAVLTITVIFMVLEQQSGIPLHVVSVIGALILVITRVITEKQAYSSIDWTTIFLLAGMMPLAAALVKSGAAKIIADFAIYILGNGAGAYALTAVLFILTATLTQFMSNTAAVTLLAPIGLVIANDMGADPRAVLMAIAIAGSASFATPVGSMPNALVFGVGNYRFMDYVKIGIPLIIIQFFICVILIPIIWPFY